VGCKVLKQKQLSVELNLSNQANLVNTIRSHLSQFNILVIVGNEYLNKVDGKQDKIPLQIHIDRSGEVTLGGLDEVVLNNEEKVRIYSDKKVTSK
jgi:hypothetical protein